MKLNLKKISINILILIIVFLSPIFVNALSNTSGYLSTKEKEIFQVGDLKFEIDFSYNETDYGSAKIGLDGTIYDNNYKNYKIDLTVSYYDKNYNLLISDVYSKEFNFAYDNEEKLNFSTFGSGYLKSDFYYYKLSITIEEIESTNSSTEISNGPSSLSKYKNLEYVIDSYNVNILVNENNTFDITETITTYFNVSKHGIYRKIPLKNSVVRLDGTSSTVRAKVTNVNVNEQYTEGIESGYYQVKIGSALYTVKGEKVYKIDYNYNLGKDKSKDYDEFYFNIIGSEWDTVIGNVTFTITMPKEFDTSKLGFSSGGVGSIDNDKIEYNVDGNIITGKYNGILNQGEALTVRLELPEGYFVGAGFSNEIFDYLLFIVPLISLLISYFLWAKYGKDDDVVETIEFYPPSEFNSLEVDFLYHGKATSNGVVSLLVYLANKGYLKITECDEKLLFGSKKGFKITKLKEYDGNDVNEKTFMEGLFKKRFNLSAFFNNENNTSSSNINEVTSSDLNNSFYTTVNVILKNINKRANKKAIFKPTTGKSVIVMILMIISTLLMVGIPTYSYSTYEELFIRLFVTCFYLIFFVGIFSSKSHIVFKIILSIFIFVHSFAMFSSLPLYDAIVTEPIYMYGVIVTLGCLFGMGYCYSLMPNRTKYGNEMLGKLKGFKTFLETAEKAKLEALVMENPTYFYDILPYTYVLDVSSKWIEKFESIAMEPPSWYDSPTGFTVASFNTFMNTTMASAKSSMTSSPSSSSGGGGSSGGGFSGGGSGGGGGGSW